MTTPTYTYLREHGHWPRFYRRQRGKSVTFNRPLYGYRVECECGWEAKINGPKDKATQAHNVHLKYLPERGNLR